MLFLIEQKHHVLYLPVFLIVWSAVSSILKYQIDSCWIYLLVVGLIDSKAFDFYCQGI